MHTTLINPGRLVAALHALTASDAAAPPAPPRRPHPPLPAEGKAYHHLIDALVDMNKRMRAELPLGMQRGYEPAQYAEVFATVRAFVGRQGGSTSYIRDRATVHDLVIVSSHRAADSEYLRYGMPCRVATPDAFSSRRLGSHSNRYNTVYIDDPEHIFGQINRRELYQLLAHDDTQTFVLLGM